MHYDKMKFTVGLFVLTSLLIFFILLFLFLDAKGSFDDRHTYYFKTTSAEAFKKGMPIKFSGFAIGSIQDIKLLDDGSVELSFSVREANTKWLSDGSVLMIIQPLLGSGYIELFTSLGSQPLANNSYLTIYSNDTINDLIQKLQPAVEKANNILNNINDITTYLANEDSELKKILVNLEIFSEKLAKDDALLTTVTGDEASTRNIIKSVNNTTLILQDVKQITQDISAVTSLLNKDIIQPTSSSIKELESIMKDIKSKLDAVDGTVKTIGSYDNDITELKNQITAGVQKSNQIMDKIDTLMQDSSNNEVVLP